MFNQRAVLVRTTPIAMINIVKKPIRIQSATDPSRNGVYFYAAYSRKGTINTVQLAGQMSETSSAFTKGEVVGVTLDIPIGIKRALLDGQAVTIDGLGTFKPALSTREVKANKEDLRASSVSIRSLNFTPDPKLLAQLNAEVQFQWIDPTAAATEDDGSTDTPDPTDDNGSTDSMDSGDNPSDPSNPSNPSNPSEGDPNQPSEDGVVDGGSISF